MTLVWVVDAAFATGPSEDSPRHKKRASRAEICRDDHDRPADTPWAPEIARMTCLATFFPVGQGLYNGQEEAFIMSPLGTVTVPEPSALVTLAMLPVGLILRRGVRSILR
jgi:hypothetical protein